jgi:hypothetical protein
MPQIFFADRLHNVVPHLPINVEVGTVITALTEAFTRHPRLKQYIFDDQGDLRRGVRIYIDGFPVQAGNGLFTRSGPASKIYVF